MLQERLDSLQELSNIQTIFIIIYSPVFMGKTLVGGLIVSAPPWPPATGPAGGMRTRGSRDRSLTDWRQRRPPFEGRGLAVEISGIIDQIPDDRLLDLKPPPGL